MSTARKESILKKGFLKSLLDGTLEIKDLAGINIDLDMARQAYLQGVMETTQELIDLVKLAVEPYRGTTTTGANIACPTGEETTILTVGGKGFCDWILFEPTHDMFACRVYCDGVLAHSQTVNWYHTNGWPAETPKIQILHYAVGDYCVMQINHRFDFRTQLRIAGWHDQGGGIECTARVYVTKL